MHESEAHPDQQTVLALLERSEQDAAKSEELFALFYSELRQLAVAHLHRQGGVMTLGATTLVHEMYLRLVGREELSFPDRARFFGYASRVMRSLVIDYARQRRAQKRGRQLAITLDERVVDADPRGADAMLRNLSDALQRLRELDAPLAELVDLHFFGGCTFAEIAAMRALSERTVQRDWRKARMLLKQALREQPDAEDSELPF